MNHVLFKPRDSGTPAASALRDVGSVAPGNAIICDVISLGLQLQSFLTISDAGHCRPLLICNDFINPLPFVPLFWGPCSSRVEPDSPHL